MSSVPKVVVPADQGRDDADEDEIAEEYADESFEVSRWRMKCKDSNRTNNILCFDLGLIINVKLRGALFWPWLLCVSFAVVSLSFDMLAINNCYLLLHMQLKS